MADQLVLSSPSEKVYLLTPVGTMQSSNEHQQRKSVTGHVEDSIRTTKPDDREPDILIPLETLVSESHRRRLAPEPVEISMRSSRKNFVPEVVETSTRSSKGRRIEEDTTEKPLVHRKVLPVPIETTSTFTRRRKNVLELREEKEQRQASHADSDLSRTSSSEGTSSRRFKPEVVEFARALYRKRKLSAGQSSPQEQRLPSPPSSAEASKLDLVDFQASRFSAAALAKQHHQEGQHSVRTPKLDNIQSESSEKDTTPVLHEVSSPASYTDQNSAKGPRYHAIDRRPINVNQLPAKAVDNDLTNQMLAAYINERPQEPVAHFANDEEDEIRGKLSGIDGIDIRTFRRDSGPDHQWELQNMQRHHAELEKMKEGMKKDTAGHSRFSASALAARHHGIGRKQEMKTNDELKKLRSAASPPMLGDDLWFPQSISPKMTRCDVDQMPRPRSNDDDGFEETEGNLMLWQMDSNVSKHSKGGLWEGLCQKSEHATRPSTPRRSGLQTPAVDVGSPLDSPRPRTPSTKQLSLRHKAQFSNTHFLPLTPPHEDLFTASIDRKLNLERAFNEQFPAHVVTQIYNYISLGYPVLAHRFDEELSKISRIPIHELRKDDDKTDVKGHVDVPEGEGMTEEDAVTGGRCKRWEALRLYCKEWYRQSPQMAERRLDDWGSKNRLRRGSWNR